MHSLRSHPSTRPASLALLSVLIVAVSSSVAHPTGAVAPPRDVEIYTDVPKAGTPETRSDTELLFKPFGFMPKERVDQIAVEPARLIDPADPKKGTCIEYTFTFSRLDNWMGVYTLIDGESWGTKPGINVQDLLKLPADAEVVCRFRARGLVGGEQVTFLCGGVTDGMHRSSLRFPVKLDPNPVKLSKDFRDFSISLKAGSLTNIVDPFCIVVTASDNRGKDSITVQVDDIRFAPASVKQSSSSLPNGWKERLGQTLWICYTPTGFDPTVQPLKRPTADDIRADLAAIRALADRAGVKGDLAGIISYGCNDGLEQIAELAKDADLSVILGIFNPNNADEVRNAGKLLERDDLRRTIAACCVGNEAITFRRATLDDIRRVAGQLRRIRAVPTTTTEIVQSYGEKELFKFDFTFVNAHGIFSDIRTSDSGAKWAIERLKDVYETAPKDHLILAKELGWPAGPAPFDAEQQAAYWKAVYADPIAKKVNVCIFDGFKNVPWKNETITLADGKKVNIGPHWPVLFDEARKPTPFSEELVRMWKKSRQP